MMNNYAPLQGVAENLAQHGRYGDSMLVHMNPAELQGIAALSPTGQLTINPVTGQQEAFLPFLAPLLGGALGLGSLGTAALGGALTWASTGSFKKGIMSALTGWGIGKAFEGLGTLAKGVKDASAGVGAGAGAGVGAGAGAGAGVTSGLSSAELVKASTQPGFDWLGSSVAKSSMPLSSPFKATDFSQLGKLTPSVSQPGFDLLGPSVAKSSMRLSNPLIATDFSKIGNITPDAATTPWWGRGGATLGGVGGKEALGVKGVGTVLEAAMQPGPMIAGAVGAGNLAQIEQQEAMDRLERERGIDNEEERERWENIMKEGFRQSQADYPQYGRSGGLVAINPENYARRRNGFNALAGNPVRMQTGGTAALRQARLRGPKTISPEDLAAAGRPGFTPEITYFQPRRVGVAPEPGPITTQPTIPRDYFTLPVQGGNLGYGYDQSLGFGEGGAQFEPMDPYYGVGRGVNYGGSYDSSAGGSSDIYDRYLPKSPSAQNQAATLISEDYPDIINNQAASDAINSATNYVSGTPASQSATQQLAKLASTQSSGQGFLGDLVQSATQQLAPAGGPPIAPAGGALDFMGGFEPTDPYGGYGVPVQPVAQAPAGRPPVPSAGLEPTDPYYGGNYGGNYGYDRFNEGGITDIPAELANESIPDEQAVMASADMLPAEAPIENEAANQLIEQTMMAVLGELPSEQAEIVIARFIDEFGEEAFQMLREQALQMAVPGAQTQGMLEGSGGGMDDQIPGMIGNQQPVAVSPGEFIVPADVVSGLGDGSSDAGAAKLDSMMDNVRMAKTGGIIQPRRISNAVLPV